MLIKNATYLGEDMKFRTSDLIVRAGKVYIEDADQGFSGEIIDGSEFFVLPGLMNCHFHSYSAIARGLPKEVQIQDWCDDSKRGRLLEQLFNNLDHKLSDEEFAVLGLYSYIEMVKQGITFVSDSDPGNNPGLQAETINTLGMRGVVEAHAKYPEYHEKSIGNVRFGAHLLEEEDITDETLQQCVEQEKAFQPLKLTHCMENSWRHGLVHSAFQKSSIELYEEKGLLDGKTILFHGVYLSPKDMDIIADHGAAVVHCPISNLWSGAGAADIREMLKREVNVCIGTDYASTDIWEDMRMAYYLLKLKGRVDEFQAEDVLKMATINGAKAYQLSEETGRVANGYNADLIFIKKDLNFYPLINTGEFSTYAHNLLTQCRPGHVQHVMVDGKWIMKDRKILTVDEQKVRNEYRRIAEKLFAEL